MKKRLFALILVLILGVTLLASCGEEEAPEGLSAVSTSNPYGVKMYCPEGWTVVNDSYNGDYRVYAAKLMGRSITSVTFTEAPMPEGSIEEYFNASIAEASGDIAKSLTVTKAPEKDSFGNAKEAYKAIYTYKYTDKNYQQGGYKEYDVTCMQYFITHGTRFYIFTYTAYGAPSDEAGEYKKYLDAVHLAVKHFEFSARVADKAPEAGVTGDGLVPVSDKTVCGYELYLPEKYRVTSSNGDIVAEISDSASLSLTRTNDAGINFFQYLHVRKTELSRIVGDITDIRVTSSADYKNNSDLVEYIDGEGEGSWCIDVTPVIDEALALGDLENIAVSYEYEYTYGGVTYRVYQLLGMTSRTGYSFTYTAPAAEYESHLAAIGEIIEKVRFQ